MTELQAIRKYQLTGDRNAYFFMYERYRGMLKDLVFRQDLQGQTLVGRDDLEAIAERAFLAAITKFDVLSTRAFSTYLFPTVKGTLQRAVRDARCTPHNWTEVYKRILEAKEKLTLSLGREPDLDEIHKEIGGKLGTIYAVITSPGESLTFTDILSQMYEGMTAEDMFPDYNADTIDDMLNSPEAMLREIFSDHKPQRDVEFIVEKYINGRTYEDIGEMYGLTRQRAEQVISNMVRRNSGKIKRYLGLSPIERLIIQ